MKAPALVWTLNHTFYLRRKEAECEMKDRGRGLEGRTRGQERRNDDNSRKTHTERESANVNQANWFREERLILEGRKERETYSEVVIRAMKRRVGGNFGVCKGLFRASWK